MSRNWGEQYKEDIDILNQITVRFGQLQENDVQAAYYLQRDSLQEYARFSQIKYDICRDLLRGEGTAIKKHLDETTTYLYSVHVACRKVYEKSSGDLKYYKED